MGQETKDSAFRQPGDDRETESASFLGPEEADSILERLEREDSRLLRAPKDASVDQRIVETMDDGIFLAPGELPQSGSDSSTRKNGFAPDRGPFDHEFDPRDRISRTSAQGLQSDLLTRVAGEIRSIKSELVTLKSAYDAMLDERLSSLSERAEAANSAAPSERLAQKAAETAPEGKYVPAERFEEIRDLFGYLDRLLESLPEDKIDEFARSTYFDLYRKVFEYFEHS